MHSNACWWSLACRGEWSLRTLTLYHHLHAIRLQHTAPANGVLENLRTNHQLFERPSPLLFNIVSYFSQHAGSFYTEQTASTVADTVHISLDNFSNPLSGDAWLCHMGGGDIARVPANTCAAKGKMGLSKANDNPMHLLVGGERDVTVKCLGTWNGGNNPGFKTLNHSLGHPRLLPPLVLPSSGGGRVVAAASTGLPENASAVRQQPDL